MSPTVHLSESLGEHGTEVECDSVDLRGNVAWLEPRTGLETLVVPIDNIAGVAGDTVDQSVERLPTQGGQYTEVVTRVE